MSKQRSLFGEPAAKAARNQIRKASDAKVADKAPLDALPQKLRTLRPKLSSAYHVLSRWRGRGGIIFISADNQALAAARSVAEALAGKTFELPPDGIAKGSYKERIGRYIDGSLSDGTVATPIWNGRA
jgi:hypothetical protein